MFIQLLSPLAVRNAHFALLESRASFPQGRLGFGDEEVVKEPLIALNAHLMPTNE